VLDIVNALAPHAREPFDPELAPERLGEVRHIALDASRAKGELGWSASVGIEDGLERTLNSLR
jgi:UDP-glucose 4-epimerase